MRDIYDYLSRLGVAVLLCPVAAAAWFAWIQAGFSFDGFMALLGSLGQQYAAMNPHDQQSFRYQFYAAWGAMAFGFLFLSFVISPPRFCYQMNKEEGRWRIYVMDSCSTKDGPPH